MAARACKCLKCDHVWVTSMPNDPKQCPKCKRKDWDGLHNSYGRLISPSGGVAGKVAGAAGCRCESCGASWSSGRVEVTECPFCRAAMGGSAAAPCECVLCGGKWVSRSAETVPDRCPKCHKAKWAAPDPFDPDGLLLPGRCACRICGNVWSSKVEGLPKRCPACRSDSWCQAVVDRFIFERNNPGKAECDIRWFKMSTGPGGSLEPHGDPVTGVHDYTVNPNNPGYCHKCGWNNRTKTQQGVNSPPKITAEEGERRKRQWELEHPGEKF